MSSPHAGSAAPVEAPTSTSTSRLRVAVFCRSFLPLSQTFVHDAVTRLARYQATVFCQLRENALAFPFEPLHRAWPGYAATLYSPNFARAFRQQPFSLVHAQFGTTAIYAMPYAQRARLPLVVSFHGYEVPLLREASVLRGPRRHFALFAPRTLRYMTLGLCASAELRDLLIDLGVPRDKLRLHRLGVDTDRFVPRPDARAPDHVRVLMVGRFVEKKGFHDGIAAFARVATTHATKLTIVGAGPLEQALKAQVQALHLAGQVQFTGPLSHDRVLRLMQSHDILLAPSRVAPNGDRDSGLIALREACSAGLVPIATRHGGLPDSVDDGATGYLVPEGDVDAISERLHELLTDRALRAQMSVAARKKMVEGFDHRVSMPVLESAYDEARGLHREQV